MRALCNQEKNRVTGYAEQWHIGGDGWSGISVSDATVFERAQAYCRREALPLGQNDARKLHDLEMFYEYTMYSSNGAIVVFAKRNGFVHNSAAPTHLIKAFVQTSDECEARQCLASLTEKLQLPFGSGTQSTLG